MIAAQLRRGEIDALMCHWAFVTARLAEAVHGAGGELYVWTVDDAERIAALERLGADGIITNDPRLFDDAAGAPRGDPIGSPGDGHDRRRSA